LLLARPKLQSTAVTDMAFFGQGPLTLSRAAAW
jgi:hypothetical protein